MWPSPARGSPADWTSCGAGSAAVLVAHLGEKMEPLRQRAAVSSSDWQTFLKLTVEPHAVPLHATAQEAEARRLDHTIDRDVIVKPGARLVQARVVFLVFWGQKQQVQPTVPCDDENNDNTFYL